MATEIDGDATIKEGHVELQTGSGFTRSFKRRYMVVKKSGIVDLYEKQQKKKRKESFHLQGGEEIQNARNYQNRFRIKIVIPEHKKPQKWTFGFESETTQKSWINVFHGVLKHLNALAQLHAVMTGSNADTMEGQLKIGAALADCGQLSKARRIFTKLISKYGQESTEVHKEYETFLSTHCNDIHQAEIHFLRRKKFFCLPKEFISTTMGQEFKKISKRIEFLTTMKNKLLSQINNNNNNNEEKIYQIEYRNIENIWPFYLYSVCTKNVKSARKMVRKFLSETNRNISSYQFEYSYQEIEQQCWYIIKQCIDGKRGAVKLQARLEAVADVEAQKKLKSQKYATKFEPQSPHNNNNNNNNNNVSSENIVFPSKEEYLKQQKQIKNNNKLPPNNTNNTNNTTTEFVDRITSESIINSDIMDEIIDTLDDLNDSDSEPNGKQCKNVKIVNKLDTVNESNNINNNINQTVDETVDETNDLINDLGLDFSDESDEDNFAALKEEMNRNNTCLPQKQDSSHLLDTELNDILDIKLDDISKEQEKMITSSRTLRSVADDDTFDIFSTIHEILEDRAHHIYPWTALMLIWMTRRDDMNHIEGDNKEQIQVILEFVYLFTRGCFGELESHWEYALLLCTLYNISNDADFEDIKYKMCLSGVRVIGNKHISFNNKNAVSLFMKQHKWLSIVKGQNKVLSMRKYFLKGCRDEIQRIHNSLNSYYEIYLYVDKYYNALNEISTRNNIVSGKEISSQSADKVQGKSTWGPRQHNKYDLNAFNLVCQNRQISPVPKPIKNAGNFDEAYMMFCLSLAAKLNPYFQKQIQIAVKNLNCKHYQCPIKTNKRCYELMKHELSQISSPRAARILDFCKCTLAFKSIIHLIKGYKALDDKFRICKIINRFHQKCNNINNYKYINIYILCKHPTIKFIKLICEVRLSLERIQQLHDERSLVKECFGQILHASEIKAIMKEVINNKVPKDKGHSPKNT